jgi:hypothetical protein
MGWIAAAILALPLAAHAGSEYGEFQRRYEVQLQAGATTYAGQVASITQPGAAYGLAVSGDVNRWVAGELGYLGSSYRSEGIVSRNGRSTIVENGGQAALKLGPSLGQAVKTYALGGVSVQDLNVTNEAASGGLIRDATEVRLPVGVGLDVAPGSKGTGVMFGVRGTYNFAANNRAFPDTGSTNSAATWTGLASLGGRF